MKAYQAVCADPAWQPKDKLPGKSRGARKNYKTMPTPAICQLAHYLGGYDAKSAIDIELRMSRQRALIADDALLGLWRLSSMQTDALDVTHAWGFTSKSELVWVKYFPCKECRGQGRHERMWTNSQPVAWETCMKCTVDGTRPWLAGCGTPWFGMGRYFRNAHETCLLATRGKMTKKIKAHNIRSTMHAPVPWNWEKGRMIHSAKPEKFYDLIERLVDGPYLELFGRRRRRGWTVLGNQVDKFARVA